MLVMYEYSEKRLIDRLKFEAGFHGIKLKDDAPNDTPAPRQSGGVSGDPDSYNHLSDEERKELTRKMMGNHKIWAEHDKPMGGKKPIDKR